jgi:hypothetical protein
MTAGSARWNANAGVWLSAGADAALKAAALRLNPRRLESHPHT